MRTTASEVEHRRIELLELHQQYRAIKILVACMGPNYDSLSNSCQRWYHEQEKVLLLLGEKILALEGNVEQPNS